MIWALQNPLIQNKNQIDFSSPLDVPLDHRSFAPGGYTSRAFLFFPHRGSDCVAGNVARAHRHVRSAPNENRPMDLVFAPSEIETWPIDRLRPYAHNAKIHGDDQVAKIAASMAKFGWTVPCMVADDGELIAGHGRILAATMLGLTNVPVIRLWHLDEAERRA